MLLTAKMYQEIVRSLRSDTRGLSDRRRYPRVGLRAKVNIVPLDENRQPTEPMCVFVRDVSAGGFGLVVRRKLKPGQLVVVQLERHGEGPLSVLCEVAQCRAADCVGTRILMPVNIVPKPARVRDRSEEMVG